MRSRWLFVGFFVYAFLLSWGIPLWDDDFTSWISKIWDRSLFSLIGEWLSPISTQPEHWGFNERPLQKIFYKIGWLISGRSSWSYWFLKSLAFAGLGTAVYRWSLMVVPSTQEGRWAGLGAAVFLMVSPGVTASFVLHMDFAPVAELLFVVLSFVAIREVEKTPVAWKEWPQWKTHREWLKRWGVLSVCVYLSYKSKADLKLLPVILLAYVLVVRRSQVRFFAFPLGLMFLLAIPWGEAAFSKLPAFVPGSSGSEIGWMWQPAKLDRIREFVWSSIPYDFWDAWRSSTLSLAGMLGPYLLLPLLGFLLWKAVPLDRVPWLRLDRLEDRARFFALIWLGVVLVAVSALPELNYTYRVRYGILTMVPMSLLLAWGLGVFASSWRKIPYSKVALGLMIGFFGVQVLQNLSRSLHYRGEMGSIMVAADDAYRFIEEKFPEAELYLMPDFRPVDYWPDMPRAIRERKWLQSADELKQKYPDRSGYVISWGASFWERLPVVAVFPGCRSANLLERSGFCPKEAMAFVMQYKSAHPSFEEAEKEKKAGRWAEARAAYEKVLRDEPGNMGAHFGVGFMASQQRDWPAMEKEFGELRRYFPHHLSVIYNHGVSLKELKRSEEAIRAFRKILAVEPGNYGALSYLFWVYREAGKLAHAREVASDLRNRYPDDPHIAQLPRD